MAPWEKYLIEHKERFMNELFDFLRIPSVSALAEHADDVARAARWVEERLKAAGIESVTVMPTGGHPVVYGEWLHAPGKPTILVYGHFDTQPVDPVELWDSPPFEPTIRGNRIYARGVSDDKGNMFIPIIVAEAILKTGASLPVNLKFLFEGQEEIGSPQLPEFISANKQLLRCDMVLSSDGAQWAEDQPMVVLGTRGLAALFIDIRGPGHDLHSGTYGGTIANPVHALVHILDTLHDHEGRITVDGFYDDVRPITDEIRAKLAELPYDEAQYLEETGSPRTFGEPGYTTYERAGLRPTLEINGLYGGFQGEGLKTVLPAAAHAKISCRLVADQDPGKIIDLLVRHVEKVAPKEVKAAVTGNPSGAIPYLIPPDYAGLKTASAVLKDIYGKEPYRVYMGGSIPTNALFLEHLGAYTIVFAFGQLDELQHSPNEFLRISGYEKGQKAYGHLFQRLGKE